MSMPELPSPNPELTQQASLNMILASIALEETALSNIINAESQKIKYILSMQDSTVCDILEVNKSVSNLLEMVMQNQLILKNKMNSVLEYIPKPCKELCNQECCVCSDSCYSGPEINPCNCCQECYCNNCGNIDVCNQIYQFITGRVTHNKLLAWEDMLKQIINKIDINPRFSQVSINFCLEAVFKNKANTPSIILQIISNDKIISSASFYFNKFNQDNKHNAQCQILSGSIMINTSEIRKNSYILMFPYDLQEIIINSGELEMLYM